MKDLSKLGKIKLKTAAEIEKSPFCIGCETLDRELWEPSEVYPFLAELPIKHARVQSGWSRCEREKGVYDFDWLDASVDGLIERGITPFMNIGYGNALYAPMKEDMIGSHPLYSEDYMQAWLRFVTELCNRYAGKVSAFEVWNEPNITAFWQPDEVDPQKYAKLFERTAALIRQLAPETKIVGGVLACINYEFTNSFLQADADLSNMDVLSFHPYRAHPDRHYRKQLGALRQLLEKHGPAHTTLWQAEFGCPSAPGSSGFDGKLEYTENIQAKVLLRKLLEDCGEGLELSEWFLSVDLHDYPKGSGRVNSKGILKAKPEVAPKVAFRALQNLGSIVNGDISPAIHTTYALDSELEADEALLSQLYRAEQSERHDVSTVGLEVNGSNIVAYWSNTDLYDQCDLDELHLIHFNCEGHMFTDPVLCDLLTGNIYELAEGSFQRMGKDRWNVFAKLPLADYPLLLCERSVVQ